MTDWNAYPNFSPHEFACPHCGVAKMDDQFMFKLQNLRTALGFPLTITSGYRCPTYNDSKGYGPAHPTGMAADISIMGSNAWELLGALDGKFNGVGIKQTGSGRFIHLDTLEPFMTDAPRPWVWSYPS